MKGGPRRWVVREGDGASVRDVLARMGEGEPAVAEGRVFVGKRRVTWIDESVHAGDEVRVGAAHGHAPAGAGTDRGGDGGEGREPPVTILFEKGGLVACAKPAGIPTVPDHAGGSHTLVARVARAIGWRPDELRITSRLDREVSGVVIFALGAEAEDRLRHARAEGCYRRRYLAVAARASTLINVDSSINVDQGDPPRRPGGRWRAPIGRGKDPRHRAADGPDAKAAETRWAAVAVASDLALLAVEPITGRTHQIRVHASHAGAPLLGDRDYGGPTRVTAPGGRVVALARIALHAARVTVPDANGDPLVAEAPVPDELVAAWVALGGAPEAWDTARSCELSD